MKWGVFRRDLLGETQVATCTGRIEADTLAHSYTQTTGHIHVARPLPDAPSTYFPAPGRAATSRAAYADVIDTLPDRAQAVYRFVANRPNGANEYEMEIGLHILHQSVSSVTLMLRRAGLLVPLRDDDGQAVTRPARTKGHTGVVFIAVHPANAVPDPFAGTNAWKRAAISAYGHLMRGDVDAAKTLLGDVIQGSAR